MNGNKLFVDTNICIYLLIGDRIVASLLDGYEIFISFITEIELYAYHSNNSLAKELLDSFIDSVYVININDAVKQKTIAVRRSHKLKLPDSIIAASALHENVSFITADKGFQKVTGLDLVLYEPTTRTNR
jgi:predicted nucleic acid-binding protein